MQRSVFLVGIVVAACCAPSLAQETILYQKPSAYSTIIVSQDDQGLRTLRFEEGGVRQSVVKPGDPDHIELAYARVMPAAMALAQEPKRILIVGLGGATIPRFLHKHFPQLTIDVVEIDPDVVAVAKQFFEFREDDRLHAYVDDGRRFIARSPNRYDIIFLDAFSAESIPYHLATREFLQEVRRALTPQGFVAANVWSRSSNELYDSMVRTYQAVFPQLYVIDVPGAGNKILLALPRQVQIENEQFTRQVADMVRQRGFKFDLGTTVRRGFRDAREDGTRGRVLTDSDARAKAG